ncbi:MAG TPA: hypothetical protein VH276_13805 [Solirubrobacteraceae bacterium]|nr:hypothetical protein [Solirubrobacteraceae bacterium]
MRIAPPLVAALAAALVLAAPAAAKPPSRCNGAKALCERHFDRVVLPAAHNAMSAQSLGWQIPNQSVAMPAQLRYGIRGLLFDTHYGVPAADGTVTTDDDGHVPGVTPGLYFCHELCEIGSTPLVAGLHQISRWLDAHPDNVFEIVNEDYVTPADFVKAMYASGLGARVYRGSTSHWPTLRWMIEHRQQVVVLAEHHAGRKPWYHLAYDGILQETPYSWEKPEQITRKANWRASCVPNRGATKGSLFLMNHWSPPIPPQQPDLAASAKVNKASVLVGRARACKRVRGRLPSIVAVDQVTAGGLLRAVRQLNGL